MKMILRFLAFLTLLASFSVTPVLAGSSLQKGTVRIVMNGNELSKCADEIVYNNKRYISINYFWAIIGSGVTGVTVNESQIDEINKQLIDRYAYNPSNNSFTFELRPYGYISFWAGSKNFNISGVQGVLINPAASYDGKLYISVEDIAYILSIADSATWSYGFDAKKNTIYIY